MMIYILYLACLWLLARLPQVVDEAALTEAAPLVVPLPEHLSSINTATAAATAHHLADAAHHEIIYRRVGQVPPKCPKMPQNQPARFPREGGGRVPTILDFTLTIELTLTPVVPDIHTHACSCRRCWSCAPRGAGERRRASGWGPRAWW